VDAQNPIVVMVVMAVVRKVRMRPATVVVLGHGQRAEVEWLLVGGRGCGGGDVARRRPPFGQHTADPVMLLQVPAVEFESGLVELVREL